MNPLIRPAVHRTAVLRLEAVGWRDVPSAGMTPDNPQSGAATPPR